ncbi:adenosine receptor A2b-like [Pholidichthys leucotaenia]
MNLQNDQVLYMALELLIAGLAVAGNVLVCWSVCINSNLQTVTNFFMVSLAVADIAVGLLAIPFAITISVGFCSHFYGCLSIACFVLILTQSSIFSLLAIAMDRYIAINNPLRYSSVVTAWRAKAIIALCWIVAVGIGLTPMFGWNTGRNFTVPTFPSGGCPVGRTLCLFEGVVPLDFMVYFNFLGFVLVPLLVMLLIYLHIFIVAQRQLRLMSLKVTQAPVPGHGPPPPSSSPWSILQREVHAAKSLAIILGLFAVCWLPLHIINCHNHLCVGCPRPHYWVMNVAIILSHANSAVNPFIYAYRIREFRLTFRRILHRHILGQRDGSCIRSACSGGRTEGGNSALQTSSHSSKEGSTCGTVVNSYVLDADPGLAPTPESSPSWRSNSDGHQTTSGSMVAAPRVMDGNIAFINAPAFSLSPPDFTKVPEVS